MTASRAEDVPTVVKARNNLTALPVDVGNAENAARFTVNLAGDVAEQLRNVAHENRVSESSIVEVALRQLFTSVRPPSIGEFLREHGACLRRRA